MRTRIIRCSLIAAAGILPLFLISMPAAQGQAPDADGSAGAVVTPRTPEGRPDLSGFWIDTINDPVGYTYVAPDGSKLNIDDYDLPRLNTDTVVEGSTRELPEEHQENDPNAAFPIPYKPAYLAKVKATAADTVDTLNPNDPQMDCKPMGITRLNHTGHHNGFQIIQNAQYVGILYEEAPGPAFRVIYLDGRRHPEGLDTSFMGHSIGHWEGDTLVVDTVGLNDETLLDEVVRTGPTAGMLLLHSDQEHVIERWTRKGNTIIYEATVEDPVMFTKPWVITPRMLPLGTPGDYIQTQSCVPLGWQLPSNSQSRYLSTSSE